MKHRAFDQFAAGGFPRICCNESLYESHTVCAWVSTINSTLHNDSQWLHDYYPAILGYRAHPRMSSGVLRARDAAPQQDQLAAQKAVQASGHLDLGPIFIHGGTRWCPVHNGMLNKMLEYVRHTKQQHAKVAKAYCICHVIHLDDFSSWKSWTPVSYVAPRSSVRFGDSNIQQRRCARSKQESCFSKWRPCIEGYVSCDDRISFWRSACHGKCRAFKEFEIWMTVMTHLMTMSVWFPNHTMWQIYVTMSGVQFYRLTMMQIDAGISLLLSIGTYTHTHLTSLVSPLVSYEPPDLHNWDPFRPCHKLARE